MKRHRLRAVLDDDLIQFLASIGIKDALERGELRCHFCNEVVSFDSLQAVIPLGKHVGVLCSKMDCLNKMEPESH